MVVEEREERVEEEDRVWRLPAGCAARTNGFRRMRSMTLRKGRWKDAEACGEKR